MKPLGGLRRIGYINSSPIPVSETHHQYCDRLRPQLRASGVAEYAFPARPVPLALDLVTFWSTRDHAALGMSGAPFSTVGRLANTLSSAFHATTFSITAVAEPRTAGTRYTFSSLNHQWPRTGEPNQAPSQPKATFANTASTLSRKRYRRP